MRAPTDQRQRRATSRPSLPQEQRAVPYPEVGAGISPRNTGQPSEKKECAVRIHENGLATKEDIDAAIKLGLNHPMGPLTLLDFVSLDTCLFIAAAMFEEYKDPRYAAPALLRRMVLAGHLGRKSGRGFYDYG